MAFVTSAFLKSSVFAPAPTHLAGVFKFIHFGEHFQKVLFSVTVLVWTEGLSVGIKLRFQIYPA